MSNDGNGDRELSYVAGSVVHAHELHPIPYLDASRRTDHR